MKITQSPGFVLLFGLLALSAAGEAKEYPPNSIGPAVMIQGVYGISYETVCSKHFCLNAMICTSGRIDFTGARIMLSRSDTSVQLRPSAGFFLARAGSSDDPSGHKSPWTGFIWPGIGLNLRTGRISTSIDASSAIGPRSSGSLGENFLTVSISLMYMF